MIRADVAVESWRPTLLATPRRPLLAITSGLIMVAVVTSWRSAQASDLMTVAGAGALAGGVALGLDDEANTMLRSSPTGALTRLGHRLAVLVPALLVAAASLVVTDRLLFDQRSTQPSAVALAALVAAGIAVEVWWSRRRHETAAEGAAVVVMAWALAGSVIPDVWLAHRFAEAWHADAPWVLGVSIVLVVAGAGGRGA